jgi:RNA polymerase sigma factor (sigma-70 family)
MKFNWNTKETLIQRAQNPDDETAWEEFVSYYENFIKMVLQQSGIIFHDADDLVQDILIRVWKGLPKFEYRKDKTKFRTWLSTIIRNSIIDHANKIKKKGGEKLELHEGMVCELSTQEIESKIKEEWLNYIAELAMEKVKECFSGQAIEVFKLSLGGASAKEIALEIGLTVESVFVLRSRIKKALQKEMDNVRQHIEFT